MQSQDDWMDFMQQWPGNDSAEQDSAETEQTAISACAEWAMSVIQAKETLLRRKDNRSVIDLPLRDMIKTHGVETVGTLLANLPELSDLYFQYCCYKEPLSEIIMFIYEYFPDRIERARKAYDKNQTFIKTNYPTEKVFRKSKKALADKKAAECNQIIRAQESYDEIQKALMEFAQYATLPDFMKQWFYWVCDDEETSSQLLIKNYTRTYIALIDRYSEEEVFDAYNASDTLHFFFKYISDEKLIRKKLDKLEKEYDYSSPLQLDINHPESVASQLRNASMYLPENPNFSEKQIREIIDFYPFLDEDGETRISVDHYNSNNCIVCGVRLELVRVNATINDSDGSYYGTFVQQVHQCPRCHRYYISIDDRERINNELIKMKRSRIVRDWESATSKDYVLHDKDYLSLPLLETDIRIDFDRNREEHYFDDDEDDLYYEESVAGLSDESFLMKLGYNTSVNDFVRHKILDNAISAFGKRRIIDHLQFCINMRKNSSKSYGRAIGIWRSDIDYVIKH